MSQHLCVKKTLDRHTEAKGVGYLSILLDYINVNATGRQQQQQ